MGTFVNEKANEETANHEACHAFSSSFKKLPSLRALLLMSLSMIGNRTSSEVILHYHRCGT